MLGLFRRRSAVPFAFRSIAEVGPTAAGDLSLVEPNPADADAFLAVAGPAEGVTALGLHAFLNACPLGRELCDEKRSGVRAAYRLWARSAGPPAAFAGTVTLRVGRGENLERYLGHVGYVVFPASRGRRYAERATRLLLPLARSHGLREVWITCNPDNAPSRRTAERLGARYVDTVAVPRRHPLHARGDRAKRRYVLAT